MTFLIRLLIDWPERIATQFSWLAPLLARVTVGWGFLFPAKSGLPQSTVTCRWRKAPVQFTMSLSWYAITAWGLPSTSIRNRGMSALPSNVNWSTGRLMLDSSTGCARHRYRHRGRDLAKRPSGVGQHR